MDNDRGWTKHYRKKWEKGYHKDHLLWVLMDYFIDHANYQDGEIFFPNIGIIPLKRGQHIFGTHKLAEFMGVGRQRIRTKLKKLEKIGFLTIKPTNKYSITTIINYNKYQSSENETNQQTNQHLTSTQPALNQQLTTHNKVKKDKKIKKNIYPPDFLKFWDSYPRKVGKKDAHDAWKNIQKPDTDFLIQTVRRQAQCEQWQKDNGQFIPYPATWLNQRRWEDESGYSPAPVMPESDKDKWLKQCSKKK